MLDGEKDIIRRAVKGESSAFGLLYDHYHGQIYRFVAIKVGRREEAEDLTHQVFLHAWERIERYKERGFPFSSWLYRIARNQVIDHYRTAREMRDIEDVDEELLAGAGTLEETTDEQLELRAVFAALHGLKEEYQDVIIMRFVDDLPIKDVASTLHKSEGAVKQLQNRALKELRDTLQQ